MIGEWVGSDYFIDGQWAGYISAGYMPGKYIATWHKPSKDTHPMWESQEDSEEQARVMVESHAALN